MAAKKKKTHTRWEYQTKQFEGWGDTGYGDKELNALGHKGWELVAMYETHKQYEWPTVRKFIFKRPVR